MVLHNVPLTILYENLDDKSIYTLRIAYFHSRLAPSIRLTANRRYLVHDYIKIKGDNLIQEFNIPPGVIVEGKLS